MRARRLLAALICILPVACAPPGLAQVGALEFVPEKGPVGQVFHFRKSQLDGTHAARISVFVASQERIEALKWDEGGDEATLVTADMDWTKFSVRHFQGWHLARGAAPEPR